MISYSPRIACAISWFLECVCVCLQTLEDYWLAHTLFLAGNEVSIADLLHGCEIDQLCMLDNADQVSSFCALLCTALTSCLFLRCAWH